MGNVIRNSKLRNIKPIAIFFEFEAILGIEGLVGKNLKIYFLI